MGLSERMALFLDGNVGAVLALYDPVENETAPNYKGDLVEIIRATDDLKEFRRLVYIHCLNAKMNPGQFVDLVYNQEKTLLQIRPPKIEENDDKKHKYGKGNGTIQPGTVQERFENSFKNGK